GRVVGCTGCGAGAVLPVSSAAQAANGAPESRSPSAPLSRRYLADMPSGVWSYRSSSAGARAKHSRNSIRAFHHSLTKTDNENGRVTNHRQDGDSFGGGVRKARSRLAPIEPWACHPKCEPDPKVART